MAAMSNAYANNKGKTNDQAVTFRLNFLQIRGHNDTLDFVEFEVLEDLANAKNKTPL